ncbi:MAG: hypothetical protein M3203_04380 [Actinomycetota bacterium]|nr:hypothetical protein [Actinomycetota bacterium]
MDGIAVGQITAEDTGDWGAGWNNFLWSPGLRPVTLAAGPHQATTTVSGGDGYGVEIDALRIERVSDSTPTNLALNPARSGFPSPLESDPGWGGGSSPWDIVDGLHTYPSWEHGLAFTGGHTHGVGSGGWVQPCGERQATVNFNSATEFAKVVLWHHPDERHVPADYRLDYWDGATWRPIAAVRSFGASRDSSAGYGSVSDEYTFSPVVGSKVRYSFNNCGNTIDGIPIVHGWLYEFEVYPG